MNKIYLIGDSTCQTNDKSTYPQKGWGQVFKNYISSDYEVINLAKNGRSTKSFIDMGHFHYVEDNLSKNDFLFIEFGHNDEKKEDLTRYTNPSIEYKDNLRFYINFCLKKKATPILLSPISRRKYVNGLIDISDHEPYRKAMEEVAKELNVLFIDMTLITKKFLDKIGDIKSREYFMYFEKDIYKNYKDGMTDNTHLRPKGAKKICELIIKELKNTDYKYILKS